MDEALLANLDARLAALPAAQSQRGVLIVLHQMGSHGSAYFKRSPPRRKPFQPECASAVVQQCALDTVINAYDNSIAYTDHVLVETIHWLERHSTRHEPVMLYVSDHAESLGENHLYLHDLPFALAPREQTHVPMVACFCLARQWRRTRCSPACASGATCRSATITSSTPCWACSGSRRMNIKRRWMHSRRARNDRCPRPPIR